MGCGGSGAGEPQVLLASVGWRAVSCLQEDRAISPLGCYLSLLYSQFPV